MLPSELGIDVAKYKSLGSGDLVGTEGYVSPEDGVEVHLFKGFIEYVLFYPPSNEENLRCQPSSMAKVGHAFIALEDSSDLSQIWLSVQPQTKVPLRIPSVPTLEGKSLYAIIESVLPSAYEIQFAFTPDCVKSVCHYGKISGRLIEHGDARPQGKKVVLAKGRVGYLVRGRCNSRCLDSTVTWDEGAYRYTVALKGGTLRALKEHANSALSMSKEL
jgi:hypothetical protein